MSYAYAVRAAWRYPAKVSIVTPASAIEPAVSITEIKYHVAQWLDDDDAQLVAITHAAEAWVEGYLGRALLSQTREASYDGAPGRVVLLPEPVASITSVTVYDEDDNGTVVTTDTYALDTASVPPRVLLRDGQIWPVTGRDYNTLVVRYVAGWTVATVPFAVRQALLLLVAHWYEQRTPVNVGNLVSTIPMGIESLLMPYRIRTGVA